MVINFRYVYKYDIDTRQGLISNKMIEVQTRNISLLYHKSIPPKSFHFLKSPKIISEGFNPVRSLMLFSFFKMLFLMVLNTYLNTNKILDTLVMKSEDISDQSHTIHFQSYTFAVSILNQFQKCYWKKDQFIAIPINAQIQLINDLYAFTFHIFSISVSFFSFSQCLT